jgi:hypothetical protein
MIQNQPGYRQPQWSFLYNGMRDFTRNARFYRNDLSDRRARQLIRQAENISQFVARNRLPYEFRNSWFALANQVELMSHQHGIDFNGGRRLARTDPFYNDRYGTSGMFRWRGRVDGSDIIYLRGNRVDIRHLEARPITNASADVSTPLPGRPVNVELRRLQGRGVVRIVEQPSASNGYAAGVLIEDEQAGADFYEFELVW